MKKDNFFKRFVETFERYIPMSFSGFIIFLFVLYLFFIVGRSILVNYNSNQDLEAEALKIASLEDEITLMKNQINYYQTSSFKEKQAREKLGYKAPGESVISLPLDREEDKIIDAELGEVKIKTPNYSLWWSYLIENKR